MDITEQSQISRMLVDVSMGRAEADLVIRQGKWVCVQTGEIIDRTDIAIKGQRIAYVGQDATHTCGPNTKLIHAGGAYLTPGLLDAHTHTEMAMVKIGEFSRAVIPHGTTGAFIDPHEFANVLGLEGVQMIMDEASIQPIHIWVQMPSCVPSAPGLENSGAVITAKDVQKAMEYPSIIGLGEMMNFPGVSDSDPRLLDILAAAQVSGRVVGGHYASTELGLPFHGYVAAGVDDDHEGTSIQDALARARQGLKVIIRFNSGIDNLSEQVKVIDELGIDTRNLLLATDGLSPRMLLEHGHMDYVVRKAISRGINPITAIQMATINTAEHFGVGKQVGQIAPGRFADILLVDDLPSFNIQTVIARGTIVYENGRLTVEPPMYTYPPRAKNTVKVTRKINSQDFQIMFSGEKTVFVHVIGMLPSKMNTRHLIMPVRVENGIIRADPAQDILKIALIERHRGSGEIKLGFVNGFGLNPGCAIGSTVLHDSHQMLILGENDENMAVAANELVRMGGGFILVKDNRPIASISLPVAGLISDDRIEQVAEQAERLETALYQVCGCKFPSAITQLTRLGLVAIPELRISDLGLIDVENLRTIPVVVE